MYKLTERRLAKAKHILDAAAAELEKDRDLNTGGLEMQLRECWDLGYQELKDIFCQMLEMKDYQNLAAFYMQFSNDMGVVSEFQRPLRKFYGVKELPLDVDFKGFWKLVAARSETAT
jgi:hypothetical protein